MSFFSSSVVMPCGCKFEKDQIAKRLQATFSRNDYDYEITCPKNKCGKIWDLADCDSVIHMNEQHYLYYAQEIEKRSSVPTKPCPFCGVDCERPSTKSVQRDDKWGYRVHCACNSNNIYNKRDWCWECQQEWKTKNWEDCGNANCHLHAHQNKNKNKKKKINMKASGTLGTAMDVDVDGFDVGDMININNSTNTQIPATHTTHTSTYQVGQQVKARDPSFGGTAFYAATIKVVEYDRVKVGYNKWPKPECDQWINEHQYADYIKIEAASGSATDTSSASSSIAGGKKGKNGKNGKNATYKNGKNGKKARNKGNNGIVGLQNLGNTCFMNSALQCLLQCPEFIELCMNDKIKLPVCSGWGSRGKINKSSLAYIWCSFVKQIYSTNRGSVAPRDIKNGLRRLNSDIGNGTQQDSFCVIETLLQGLEDELCADNPDRMEYDVKIEHDKDRPSKDDIDDIVDKLWRKYCAHGVSVRDIFDGVECEKTRCCACNFELQTFQSFRQIELPLCNKIISLRIKVFIPEIRESCVFTENLTLAYDNTMDGIKYILLPKLTQKYELKNTVNIRFGCIKLNASNKSSKKSMNGWIEYLDDNDNCSKIKCHSQIFAVVYTNNKQVSYVPQFNLICNEKGTIFSNFVAKSDGLLSLDDEVLTFKKLYGPKKNMCGKQMVAEESKVNHSDYESPIIFYNNRVVNASDNVKMQKNGCLLRIFVHKKYKNKSPASVSKVRFDANDQLTIQCALNESNKSSLSSLECLTETVKSYWTSLANFTFHDLSSLLPGFGAADDNKQEIAAKTSQAKATHNKLKTLSESAKVANKWLSWRLDCIAKSYEADNINYTKAKMLDNLDDCLAVYELNETSNANVLDCPRCAPQFPEIVSRKVDILKTPKVLLIHIDREDDNEFGSDANANNYGGYYGASKKRDNLIKYKVNGLKFKNDVYDLFGVVVHHGHGTDFGHYVGFVRSLANEKWYKMNDSSVSQMQSKQQLVSNNASVLLYKKRSQQK